LDFQGDGKSVCVEIHSQASKGEYSLDCRANPWQPGWVLPVPEEMAAEAGPQVLAAIRIVRLAGAGDVLHFCQAIASPDRPQASEGPGYFVLRPAVPMPQEEEKQKKKRALLSSSAATGIPASTKSPRSAGSSNDNGGPERLSGLARRLRGRTRIPASTARRRRAGHLLQPGSLRLPSWEVFCS
jgi:hypothetical protein